MKVIDWNLSGEQTIQQNINNLIEMHIGETPFMSAAGMNSDIIDGTDQNIIANSDIANMLVKNEPRAQITGISFDGEKLEVNWSHA
ncbi:MAG: hypothetical protein WCS30_00040 [Selenomonadaceae bacterium]